MVGTVLAWATLESTGSLWLAFIVARLIGFVVGAFIQRTVIQPIRVRAARRMTCMFTPLPQSQVSDLDQGPANRSRRVNLSPCSEREQSLPRTEMRDDTPDGRPCRPRKHLRNQREQTLSNRASGPCSRHHHSLFACADEEVLYRECFSIVLIASLGPFQPRNLIYCLQERWWPRKTFRVHQPLAPADVGCPASLLQREPDQEAWSCIGCARCLLIERRKTASRRSRSGTHPGITCAEWSASQTAMAHGTAATTITSTSIPGRQKSVVRQARAGGFAGSTHSFQTEL